MSTTYAQAMDEVRFSDDEKAAMAERLAAAALASDAEVIPMKRTRKSSVAKMAAAVGLVAVLGGAGVARAATTYVSVDQFASVVFGGAPATQVEDKVGRPLGVSAHDNGVTVTADAVIGDARNVALVFSVARDDGEPVVPGGDPDGLALMFAQDDVLIPGVGGMGGGSFFYDADPSDGTVQFVVQYALSDVLGGSVRGRWAHVRLADLTLLGTPEQVAGYVGEGAPSGEPPEGEARTFSQVVDATPVGMTSGMVAGTYVVEEDGAGEARLTRTDSVGTVIVPGAWEFDIQLGYEDAGVALEDGVDFWQDGEAARVLSASVSPVALSLAYRVDSQAEHRDAPSGEMPADMVREQDHYLLLDEVVVELADGREVLAEDNGGGFMAGEAGSTRVEKSVALPELVDSGQVVAVRVNGTRLAVR